MTWKGKLKERFDTYEKTGIALVFFALIINFFLNDASLAVYLIALKLIGLSLLWGLYMSVSDKDLHRFPLALLAFYIIAAFMSLFGIKVLCISYLAYLAWPVFGLVLFVQAVKESLQYKTFELIIFLAGICMILTPVIYLNDFRTFKQLYTYFNFGFAFIVATILYNDNLWQRFSFNAKNTIKFIFIITVVLILSSSLKSLSL